MQTLRSGRAAAYHGQPQPECEVGFCVSLQGVTALDPVAQDFDLMYEQTKALKEGKPVQKPIYNHVSGKLDPAEEIKAPKVGLLSLSGKQIILTILRVMEHGTSQLNRVAELGHPRLLRALECSNSLVFPQSVACCNVGWWPTRGHILWQPRSTLLTGLAPCAVRRSW